MRSRLLPILFLALLTEAAFAGLDDDTSTSRSDPKSRSVFAPSGDPNRPRSDVLIPALSFLLPLVGLPAGLDQWWEGQYGSAAVYTGLSLGGLGYAISAADANGRTLNGEKKKDKNAPETAEDDEEKPALDTKDFTVRRITLGTLIHQGSAGMSTYHSFRTAVRSRKGQGQYDFLKYEETPTDIMLAPFHFSFLKRPSTYVPLAIGAALFGLVVGSEPPENTEKSPFTNADAFFTGAYSYNAGTHEEGVFRGWIQPAMYEAWRSPFGVNATQAILFAAAHLATNPQPVPQLLLGYHLGNVTMANDWRLSEAVFIHVWWDVLAFAGAFHYKVNDKTDEDTAARAGLVKAAPLTLWLPPLFYHF